MCVGLVDVGEGERLACLNMPSIRKLASEPTIYRERYLKLKASRKNFTAPKDARRIPTIGALKFPRQTISGLHQSLMQQPGSHIGVERRLPARFLSTIG